MAKIKQKILNTINEQLELSKELDFTDERKAQLLKDVSFDVIHNYDDPKRLIEKISMCYGDYHFDNKEDIEKKIDELITLMSSHK